MTDYFNDCILAFDYFINYLYLFQKDEKNLVSKSITLFDIFYNNYYNNYRYNNYYNYSNKNYYNNYSNIRL